MSPRVCYKGRVLYSRTTFLPEGVVNIFHLESHHEIAVRKADGDQTATGSHCNHHTVTCYSTCYIVYTRTHTKKY
jgi:hypothetical protein